ncbi:MAG: hypothetical protein ACOZE5_03710 [Verrucomicrobiota bacterium]
MKNRPGLFAIAGACLVVAAALPAREEEEEETAVHSKVFNDYARTPSVLGGYQPETFAFANGGALLGHLRDRSVDDATFDQVIRLVSPALTRQNYIAATDPEDTDLLIFITWGATGGYDSMGLSTSGDLLQTADLGAAWYGDSSRMDEASRRRDRANASNAALLGYREAMRTHRDMRAYGVQGTIHQDLVADVEEPRYFVILVAFDFRTAWKEKKLIPLWSTRYNIPTRGNHFTAALPSMSQFASRYFGRDSGGLIRRLNPTGKVEMEDVKILGAVGTPAE